MTADALLRSTAAEQAAALAAGAAKPASRRATRETRATVFIKETPVQGRCQRTIYPTILVVRDKYVSSTP